jgi:YVTN family beta-propeller protein
MLGLEKIAIHPNGKRAFVTDEGTGFVSVIDTDRTSVTYNQVVDTITDPRLGSPEGAAVNPCGTLLVVTNEQITP